MSARVSAPGAGVSGTSSALSKSKPVAARTASSVWPGCSEARRKRPAEGSKRKTQAPGHQRVGAAGAVHLRRAGARRAHEIHLFHEGAGCVLDPEEDDPGNHVIEIGGAVGAGKSASLPRGGGRSPPDSRWRCHRSAPRRGRRRRCAPGRRGRRAPARRRSCRFRPGCPAGSPGAGRRRAHVRAGRPQRGQATRPRPRHGRGPQACRQ